MNNVVYIRDISGGSGGKGKVYRCAPDFAEQRLRIRMEGRPVYERVPDAEAERLEKSRKKTESEKTADRVQAAAMRAIAGEAAGQGEPPKVKDPKSIIKDD